MEEPVIRPEAVMAPALNPLASSNEPAKELEARPVEMNWAPVVTLPPACIPKRELIEPEKELLPTPVKEATPAEVRLPFEPLTLNLSVEPTSKLPDTEALPVIYVLVVAGLRVRSPTGEILRLVKIFMFSEATLSLPAYREKLF